MLTSKEQKVFWSGMKDHQFNAHSAAKAVIRLSRKYIGQRVLDAGAGDGTLGRELKGDVWSVDIAPANPSVEQGDITDLRYDSCLFDTVFCLDVLEHLTPKQSMKAISEMRRVLKRGGHLIITSPYKENLASNTLTCPFCAEKFHKSGHQQVIDRRLVSILGHPKGFNVRKVKVCNLGFMQLFGFPARLFYSLGLHEIFKHKLLTKNIFIVAQKE